MVTNQYFKQGSYHDIPEVIQNPPMFRPELSLLEIHLVKPYIHF